jgi:hypothetical protein
LNICVEANADDVSESRGDSEAIVVSNVNSAPNVAVSFLNTGIKTLPDMTIPCHIMEIETLPIQRLGDRIRKFSASWYKLFPWLHWQDGKIMQFAKKNVVCMPIYRVICVGLYHVVCPEL